MNNYFSKICPELLKVVTLNYKEEENYNDCIVYSDDFLKLKKEIFKITNEVYEYPFIKAIGVKLSHNQIIKCAKVSTVKFISKQTKVSAQINVSKKILALDNFYKKGIYGKGVTLAIIDTGINSHLDFMIPKNRIIKFVDLINNKSKPYDDNGHGSFVAGIACGNGLISNKKYSGVAPQSNIISIKALETNGETGAYKILEAMQWVFDNKDKYNIKVVCMSFGSNPLDSQDPLVLGAEALWNAGIVVVAAAGNSGPDNITIKSPGFSNKIITVGGLDDKRRPDGSYSEELFDIAKFSSRGPAGQFFKPDLVAPSVNIVGVSNTNELYTVMSGTSVATPMVAGICCLILSKFPLLTPDQLKVRLLRNCNEITGDKNKEGFGICNFNRFFD